MESWEQREEIEREEEEEGERKGLANPKSHSLRLSRGLLVEMSRFSGLRSR